MKNTFSAGASLAFLLTVASIAPANAQGPDQLRQENARLKARIEALQSQRCDPDSTTATGSWSGDGLHARIDSIRPGLNNHDDARISVTITLRNTTSTPMALNYQSRSFSLVDDVGYQYSAHLYGGSVKGIPTANSSSADTTAILGPGSSRTVTFIAARSMKRGQTIGRRFDMNATFIQIEDLGQGRVRKVRDYPVAFTDFRTSGL